MSRNDDDPQGPMNSSAWRGPIWARIACLSLGLLLIVTACLKAYSPSDNASLQVAYGITWPLLAVVIHAELLVGALLLWGIGHKWTWTAVTALFFGFCAFSLYRALAGFETCGCFGPLKVSPWWTLTLDALALTSLIGFRRKLCESLAHAVRFRVAVRSLATYGVLAVATTASLITWRPHSLESSNSLTDGGPIVLEPERWIGQSLSLRGFISPDIDVVKGDWVIVLYHHDCPKCQEAIPQYERLARHLSQGGDTTRFMLLEVPPFATEFVGESSYVSYAHLTEEREWFVQTPLEVQVRNGTVTSVSPELPSLHAPERSF